MPAAAISTHYRRAGAVSDRALEWSVRAAEELTAGLGWEEAIGHLEFAAALMDRLDVPSAQRARLLGRLADLKYAVACDLDGALRRRSSGRSPATRPRATARARPASTPGSAGPSRRTSAVRTSPGRGSTWTPPGR